MDTGVLVAIVAGGSSIIGGAIGGGSSAFTAWRQRKASDRSRFDNDVRLLCVEISTGLHDYLRPRQSGVIIRPPNSAATESRAQILSRLERAFADLQVVGSPEVRNAITGIEETFYGLRYEMAEEGFVAGEDGNPVDDPQLLLRDEIEDLREAVRRQVRVPDLSRLKRWREDRKAEG